MKRFFIYATNSCLERMLDCQKIYNYMVANGWHSVKKISEADFIIVSTCSLTEDEDEISLEYIRHCLNKKRKETEILIAGCLPIIMPDKFQQLGKFTTISPTKLQTLDEIINPNIKFNEIDEPNDVKVSLFHKLLFKQWLLVKSRVKKIVDGGVLNLNFGKKYFVFLKRSFQYFILLKAYIDPFLVGKRSDFYYLRISKGCVGGCSYCAKRRATGVLRSKSPENVIGEFVRGLQRGDRNFFLVTEDSGCYGMDVGMTVVDLLEKLFFEGRRYDFKLVISNFNARWMATYYKQLEKIFIENQKKIHYFQIPIQSGSNRILNLMKRHYRIEDVECCLKALKEKAPLVPITTDIIVGFPGETEDDFKMTKEFMQRVRFDFADIFPFQNRPNTLASKMHGKVSDEVVNRRVVELVKMQDKRAKMRTVFKKCIELVLDYKAAYG